MVLLLVCPKLNCDLTLQNQHSNNQQFSGGYSFDLMGKEK